MINIFSLLLLLFSSFLNAVDCFSAENIPRISKTESPMKIRETKSCKEYLSICERSCNDRGSLYKFQCTGQDFQPFDDHSFCQCADDISYNRSSKKDSIQVKLEN